MQFTTTAIIAAFAAIAAAAPGGGYGGGCQTGNCGGGYGGGYGGNGQLCCYRGQTQQCWAAGTPGYPGVDHPDVDVYSNCNGNDITGLIPVSLCDNLNGAQIVPVNLQLLNFGQTSGGNVAGGNSGNH
ncbi:hypothetical protein CBER1_07623 [Cercospora berteroae]|uniref:Hydrophobin n=1 Tax=Cercospora berteroae TaxID=357750 RepID=A0A2S6C9S4_9PEZI|nr:hypothetical protein CBER1_07623 [Cercospora berteroae]